MSTRIVGTLNGEGFDSVIRIDDKNRIYFTADADICADGANGQNGQRAAYMVGNKGSEDLANGGMVEGSKVICAHNWARDIVILGKDNQPKVFKGGVIASKTWYKRPDKAPDDPAAYLDAETEPYMVVPRLVIQCTPLVVRGCLGIITWRGKKVQCVVGEKGPANRNGELSIAAARALGMNADPRRGGIDKAEVLYEIFPGVVCPGYELLPA